MLRSSSGGNVVAFWSFETPLAPSTGWTSPYTAACVSTTTVTATNLLDWDLWTGTTSYKAKGTAAATMPMVLTFESAVSSVTLLNQLNAANEITGEFPIVPVELFHSVTTGQRGDHGLLADMYFTCHAVLMGDTFPADGSKEFTVIGDNVVPSGGETMELG